MKKTLLLLMAAYGYSAQAAPSRPFTQNSSGLTQNNTSGLTQGLGRPSPTATQTATDTATNDLAISRPAQPVAVRPGAGAVNPPARPSPGPEGLDAVTNAPASQGGPTAPPQAVR